MKRILKSICFLFSFVLLINTNGLAQNEDSRDSLSYNLKKAAREIMTAAGTCTLITLDHEGRPRAREMDAFLPESDFTVWFGTNPKSRKVKQIKNDSRATLYYLDSDRSGYVMIFGKAQIVNDKKDKEKYWKNEWNAFYPNKQEGFTLIKVTPEWLEVVSNARGISGDPKNWEPIKVYFNLDN